MNTPAGARIAADTASTAAMMSSPRGTTAVIAPKAVTITISEVISTTVVSAEIACLSTVIRSNSTTWSATVRAACRTLPILAGVHHAGQTRTAVSTSSPAAALITSHHTSCTDTGP